MPRSKRQSQRLLVILNIAHIIVGILSLTFALLQFTPIGLDNATYIDFRLLNIIHIMTGAVGAHMVARNFGSVVAKSLYCLSLTLALWTLAFYSDTLVQESTQYESMRAIRRMDGGAEVIDDDVVRNHAGKLAVCATMIVLALAESGFSVASIVVLERLASDTYSNLKSSMRTNGSGRKTQSINAINRRRQMAFVALMKIFFSIAAVALGAYLESLYKKRTGFIKIGWQELTGAIAFASACVDMHALYGRTHNLLNLKISLVLSVVSAVLSIKTLDYNMSSYFVLDVREYSRYDELKSELQENASSGLHVRAEGDKKDAFVKFLIHASIIGSLALLFAHSVISAVEASSYIEWGGGRAKPPGINVNTVDGSRLLGTMGTLTRYPNSQLPRADDESDSDMFEYDETLHRQKSCAGILQCIWGLALVALCVISLVSWDFSRGYDGGVGVLWLGCLFLASGLVNASRPKTFTTSVYVLNVISLVLAFERSVYSVNVIYQAVRNPRFRSELDTLPSTDAAKQRANYDAHIGRITLYAVEAGVLIMEFFTAAWTTVKVSQAIKAMPRPSFHTNNHAPLRGPLCSLGFFHLLYAFVTIAVSIAAEVALWGFNVHVSYLVYLTNGVVVFAAVFVQWMASQHPQFLLSSAILNAVTASSSFFVMAPAARDLYILVANYRSVYEGKHGRQEATGTTMGTIIDHLDAEQRGRPIQEWIIGLSALVLLLAIAEYVVSIVSGMICSYLLHHAYDPMTSDLRFSTLRSQPPAGHMGHASHYWSPSGGGIQPPSILTSKYDGVDGRLSRRQSHSSLAAVEGMLMSGARTDRDIQERYFGGTADFRLYGRHAAGNNERVSHYPNTSTMPSAGGLRRTTDFNGHAVGRHAGSVPSVIYGANNGYNGQHYGTASNVNGYTNNTSTRVNGYSQQTNARNGFPNGSYMTSYT